MSAWTVGPFKHGQVVRFKEGHPFHSYGWGVVYAKLGDDCAGIAFPNTQETDLFGHSRQGWIPAQVNELEPKGAEIPDVFNKAFSD